MVVAVVVAVVAVDVVVHAYSLSILLSFLIIVTSLLFHYSDHCYIA